MEDSWFLIGLVLVRAKGKMTFLLLFILGRQQEECRSSCSIPAGRSHPCEFQSATATTLPVLTQGGFGCIQALYSVNNTSSGSSKLLWQ